MIKGWLGAKLTNFLEEWDYFPAMFNFEYPSFLSLPVSSRLQTHQSQRGSWINTDRFPKQTPKAKSSSEVRGMGHAPAGKCFGFFMSLKRSLSWVSEWCIQDICHALPFSSRMEPFKSAGYFIKVNFHIDRSGYGERFQLNGKLY